jgi:hypothetical protein
MLKMAVSLFTTLAVANLMAQCGPKGCGYQGGYQGGYSNQDYQGGYSYPSQNYNQGGYQGGYGYSHDGYSNPYHGGGGFGESYNDHYFMDGGGHDQQVQGGYYQDHGMQPDHGAMNQGQHYHDGVYGYDQPMQDHPVQDASGQHIKYYGKPGPDYNAQGGGAQQNLGAQQNFIGGGSAQQNPQQSNVPPQGAQTTSYNYTTSSYDWDRLADASAGGSPSNPRATGTPSAPSGTPAGSKGSTGTSSASKW